MEKHDIETFLKDYAKALSANDLPRIAAAWHIPSLVIAHGEAVVASRAEQIDQLFAAATRQYSDSGIFAVKLRDAAIEWISDRVAHATVTWKLQRADGSVAATEDGFYVISRSGSPPRFGIDFFAHD